MKKRLGTLLCLSTLLTIGNASSFGQQKEFNYTINTEKPVNFEISLTNTQLNCHTQLKLLDKNNKEILKTEYHMAHNQKGVFNAPVDIGNYTIKYRTLSSGCNKSDFNLKVTRVSGNFEIEPNDDLSSATKLKELKYIYGYLQRYSDEDFYQINLPTKGILDLEFLHKKIKSFSNFQIEFIDSNDKIIVKFESHSQSLKTERKFGLNKGVYFIKIKRHSSSAGLEHHEYKMAYAFSKNENIETQPNDDFSNASLVNDGVYVSGTYNQRTKDYFKYKAKKGKYSLLYEHKAFKYGTRIEIFDSNQKKIKDISQKGLKEKEYFDFEVKQNDTIYIRFEKSSLHNEVNEQLLYKFGIIKSK